MPPSVLHGPILDWYAEHARDLPWRKEDASPWAVLVSEVMLQQTPVNRVLPAYHVWLQRWPQPAELAASPPGEAIRAWGRLGYPRRALRLHAAATAIVDEHDGEVPSSYQDLVALPGVGAYTAAAVASFAFGQRHAVLDTNVRRVLARIVRGHEHAQPSLTRTERLAAERLVPDRPDVAARWAVAVMELGAVVCTARTPRCTRCPVVSTCRWNIAGKPAYVGPRRRPQGYAGTDRQLRGLVLALLRECAQAVAANDVARVWPDPEQLERALDGLRADGLIEWSSGGYALPSRRRKPEQP
jgi:A/G-specific adenine glycosylase